MTGGSEADAHRDLPMATSAPHGFCDDEASRRLRRSRPPHQALAWAETVLGVLWIRLALYEGARLQPNTRSACAHVPPLHRP